MNLSPDSPEHTSARPSAGHWTALTAALVVIYAAILLVTFRDYGITWDESEHAEYGAEVIRWYESGFQDTTALGHRRYRNMGALFDVPPALLARESGMDLYDARHLFGALFGILGLIFTSRLAAHLGGARAGAFAALALLLTPTYYGHVPNNPKDIPYSALSIVALYYIILSLRHMPRIPPGLVLRLGIAIGLTLGIRIIGLIHLPYLAAAFLIWLLFQSFSGRIGSLGDWSVPRAAGSFTLRFAAVGAIAFLGMLPWWPSLEVDPLHHLGTTLKMVWAYPWNLKVLFEGHLTPAPKLPWYYVLKSLLVTLPDFLVLLLGSGVLLAASVMRRNSLIRLTNEQWMAGLVLALTVAFPIGSQIVRDAVVYDGWRHFLFVAPVLAIAAGCVLSVVVDRSTPGWLKYPVAAAVGVSMLLTAREMVQLHPYQSLYFSHVAGGGVEAGARSYETDYWGSSYKEGVEWLQQNYRPRDAASPLAVTSCSHPVSTTHYLTDPRFEYVGNMDHLRSHPDLFLATTRWNCHERLTGRVLHVVTRLGVPILYVKEVGDTEPVMLDPSRGPSTPGL